LKDWVVKVSIDGWEWIEVDWQTGSSGKGAFVVFLLAQKSPAARYVQLEQTGPAHSAKHFLALAGFELFSGLFGTVKSFDVPGHDVLLRELCCWNRLGMFILATTPLPCRSSNFLVR
jgi:hypothetical protein